MRTHDQWVRIAEMRPMGAGTKLAVIEFGGKQLLIAITRAGIVALATDDRGDFNAP
mgnify:CR=1 FL=1